jgi:hypothetical protein
MSLGGGPGDHESLGDFVVAEAVSDERDHLSLACVSSSSNSGLGDARLIREASSAIS